MGQTVVCPCGQTNRTDSYGFGEPWLCVACGNSLVREPAAFEPYMEDGFLPEVSGLDTEVEPEGTAPLTGFESPSAEAMAPKDAPANRPWHDGVREAGTAGADGESCARCRRTLRGDWDRHERPEGFLCHICASQADRAYRPPAPETRRALLRPDPPRKLAPPKPDPALRSKKKREIIIFCTVAFAVMTFAMVMPVEEWVAVFFSTDMTENEALYRDWRYLILATNCFIDFFAQAAIIFAALYWQRLLYPGGLRENVGPLLYTAFWFMVINALFGHNFAIGLIGLIPKSLVVTRAFNFGLDNIVAFLLALAACGLILVPARAALFAFAHGLMAAIVL